MSISLILATFAGEMRPSSIKYDPYKTLEQIATDSGVTVEAVRRYIKTRHIDRKCDEEIIKYRRVKDAIRKNPYATIPEIAKSLSMAIGTVRKYSTMKFSPRPCIGKFSMIEQSQSTLYVSISNSQNSILRAILTTYLKGAITYDCDLTYGKGDFYSESVPPPLFLYDINPQVKNVKNLDVAINLPNEQFESVVIDLPCSIVRPTTRRKKQTFVSFDSTEELHTAYHRMMILAYRLLKESGIMVFKTADFSLDNQPLWISDWSINTAIQIGFTLSDKFIYMDQNAIDAVTSSQRRATMPTHAYFLVFKKSARH